MRKYFIGLLIAGLAGLSLMTATRLQAGAPPRQEYYELKVYHLKNAEQEQRLDTYLKEAFIPALHRAGIAHVGVFKPVENAADKKVYVFIPYRSLEQFEKLPGQLEKDAQHKLQGKDYLETAHDNPVYERFETMLLKAFSKMPKMALPDLDAPKSERIYELRSYEGPSEMLYRNKVQMFNEGDEVGIFRRLGFNAVFYAEVLAGSHMPNLMYMTTFSGKDSRDKHWKAFGGDPQWKELSSRKEYQNNVSHSDILFLRPADYSDI
ncbi:MAG TPA: NIPSNAP family protein [Anseongella sp.]|nr:NIPSNAP family protein [Anseongella sp.]